METQECLDRINRIEKELRNLNFYVTPPQKFISIDDLKRRLTQIDETATACARLLPECDDKTIRNTLIIVRLSLNECADAARCDIGEIDVTAPIQKANCTYKFLIRVWMPYNQATDLIALIKGLMQCKDKLEELKQQKQ